MNFQCSVVVLVVGVLLGCVSGHPGRPPMVDNEKARELFRLVDGHSLSPNDTSLEVNEVNQLFEQFDIDGDDRIQPAEFNSKFQSMGLGTAQMASLLFQRVDTDHNGVITRFPDVERVFQYFDTNGDKQITEVEFVIVWSSMSN